MKLILNKPQYQTNIIWEIYFTNFTNFCYPNLSDDGIALLHIKLLKLNKSTDQ